MNAPTIAEATRLEEEHALRVALDAAPSPYETTIDLASYCREQGERTQVANDGAAREVLAVVEAARLSFLRRVLVRIFGAPPVSETEQALRLLAVWTQGKPQAADEVLVGLAVLTVRQVVTLTGGR